MSKRVVFEYVLKDDELFVLANDSEGIKLTIMGEGTNIVNATNMAGVDWKSTLNDSQLGLYEELRILRNKLADSEGIRPYMIFNNRTLVDMCHRMPSTSEEMLNVAGVGAVKFEKYGDMFLDVINSEKWGDSNPDFLEDME